MENLVEIENGAEIITENKLPIKKASLVLRAINAPVRQQIVKFIAEHDKVTVTEIHSKLQLEQPVASRHLAILRQAKVVKTYREGRFIYYSADADSIKKIIDCVKQLYQLAA